MPRRTAWQREMKAAADDSVTVRDTHKLIRELRGSIVEANAGGQSTGPRVAMRPVN